jgi:hypothetical protein
VGSELEALHARLITHFHLDEILVRGNFEFVGNLTVAHFNLQRSSIAHLQ